MFGHCAHDWRLQNMMIPFLTCTMLTGQANISCNSSDCLGLRRHLRACYIWKEVFYHMYDKTYGYFWNKRVRKWCFFNLQDKKENKIRTRCVFKVRAIKSALLVYENPSNIVTSIMKESAKCYEWKMCANVFTVYTVAKSSIHYKKTNKQTNKSQQQHADITGKLWKTFSTVWQHIKTHNTAK